MRDIGPFDLTAYHVHPEAPVRKYASAFRGALQGTQYDHVLAEEAIPRREPYEFQAALLDAPDELDEMEGRNVLQAALTAGVPLTFDYKRRGFVWQHVVERLEYHEFEVVAPSLARKRRGFLGLGRGNA